MASQSLDLVLNAFDATGPAFASAAANVDAYGQAIEASNAAAVASAAPASAGVASVAAGFGIAALKVAAVGAAAYLVYSHFDELVQLATRAGAAISEGWTATVLPALASVGEGIAAVAQGLYASVSEIAGAILGYWSGVADGSITFGDVFNDVATGVVMAIATLEFGFNNWRQVGELALVGMQLAVVRLGNQIHHVFTEVIPKTLIWLADNWRDIFRTIYDFVATVIANMHENLVRFFTAVIEWMQGNGFNFEWVALTDGFESSIKELPKILEREVGPLEQSLSDTYGQLADQVGRDFNEHLGNRLAQMPANPFETLKNKLGGIVGNFFGGGSGGAARDREQPVRGPELVEGRLLTGAGVSAKQDFESRMLRQQQEATGAAKETALFLTRALFPGLARVITDATRTAERAGVRL